MIAAVFLVKRIAMASSRCVSDKQRVQTETDHVATYLSCSSGIILKGDLATQSGHQLKHLLSDLSTLRRRQLGDGREMF